jgi:hypothetical protein
LGGGNKARPLGTWHSGVPPHLKAFLIHSPGQVLSMTLPGGEDAWPWGSFLLPSPSQEPAEAPETRPGRPRGRTRARSRGEQGRDKIREAGPRGSGRERAALTVSGRKGPDGRSLQEDRAPASAPQSVKWEESCAAKRPRGGRVAVPRYQKFSLEGAGGGSEKTGSHTPR